ncbi:MAG: 5-formyltetrahydrofolate cyclo-ligase [Advenella sp.]
MKSADTPTLRQSLLAARSAIPDSRRQMLSVQIKQHILDWLQGRHQDCRLPDRTTIGSIAGFWPIRDEPDMISLLHDLHTLGHDISLPVIEQRDAPLHFYRWSPDTPLRRGAFNIPEPQVDTPAILPSLILVPTLGYTRDGHRLGYGKGYYDRTLHALAQQDHNTLSVGIGWDEGLIDGSYLPAAHDMPLDAIVTPGGWIVPARNGAD